MSQTPASSSQNEYFDLGSFQRQVTTADEGAQVWFNRGLAWCYAFNHEEAAECFEKAIAKDFGCAMAYVRKLDSFNLHFSHCHLLFSQVPSHLTISLKSFERLGYQPRAGHLKVESESSIWPNSPTTLSAPRTPFVRKLLTPGALVGPCLYPRPKLQ
jgi:hypothetical protein